MQRFKAGFFAARPFAVNSRIEFTLSGDMLKNIAKFLPDASLDVFRNLCVQTYNAIETNTVLLIRHRLHKYPFYNLIGSHFVVADRISIFSAFQYYHQPNYFWVQRLQVNALSEVDNSANYRCIRITNANGYNLVLINHDIDRIWERAVTCKLDKEKLQVKAEFSERLMIRHPQGGYIEHATGTKHHFFAEFDVKEFDEENKQITITRQLLP